MSSNLATTVSTWNSRNGLLNYIDGMGGGGKSTLASTTVKLPHHHSYKNGVCAKCGAQNPNYTEPEQTEVQEADQGNEIAMEAVIEETSADCSKGHTYGADGKCTRCGTMSPVAVLESKYNTASAQLERNRSSAQQRVAVSLAKLQKYLPQQLKAQGLSGLGVSQTAALRMMNNYNAQMGEIDRDYNAGASDLLANYSDGRVALESAAAQDALAREQLELQKYQIDEQNKANADTKAYSLYSDIINMIDAGDFKTSGELTAYIDAHREDLGDYADRLDVIAKSRGEYIDEVAKDEADAKAATEVKITAAEINGGDKKMTAGDNFSIKIGNDIYRVESGGEVLDQAIKNAAMAVKDDQVFGYGENLYVKKSGKIYAIQKRELQTSDADAKRGYQALYNKIFK